jgi:hypothetical protein
MKLEACVVLNGDEPAGLAGLIAEAEDERLLHYICVLFVFYTNMSVHLYWGGYV